MKALTAIFLASICLLGCTRYSNRVQTEGGGQLTTSVVAFGAKVDLAGIESDKELGPDGLKQSTKADAASGEAQLRDLAAVFLAGSQVGSSGGPGLSDEVILALINRPPATIVVTNAPAAPAED
jgi:hypothetical protein